jgi:hypothetical protein
MLTTLRWKYNPIIAVTTDWVYLELALMNSSGANIFTILYTVQGTADADTATRKAIDLSSGIQLNAWNSFSRNAKQDAIDKGLDWSTVSKFKLSLIHYSKASAKETNGFWDEIIVG